MDYELAKQLKDAGFPQKRNEGKIGRYKYMAYEPTLSELIEACGETFGKLIKDDGHWYAYSQDRVTSVTGSTPEEAVGRLWLSLNSQQI